MKEKKTFTVLCALLLLLSSAANAQDQRASISGTVTDPSGAVIPGVQVRITSVERGTITETLTNDAGVYVVPFLIPGQYSLSVEMQGFKKFERTNIQLRAADKLDLDIRLEVGAPSETVQVSTTVSTLQTETATRAMTVDNKTIDSIPTSGRNLYQLQYSMPGVIKNSRYHGSMELYAFGNIDGVMISGGRSGENETIIDGITNTKGNRGVVIAPALNATQEMTLQSNTYDAQFGRLGGGVTMITLKSGTNLLHGQLFEFHKNYKLGGNDWAANKAGESDTFFLNNTFGYTVDGPIYIPKFFDGRNKAFFMTSLEGLRERELGGQMTTVPTAEMRSGDFSKLLNGASKPVIIYDPLTTTKNAAGAYVRTPFAGNRLPSNRINPIAAKVASYIPMPNSAGDGPNFRNNYYNMFPAKNGYNAWMHKVDLRLSDKHSLAFRYGRNYWSNWSKVVWGTNEAEPSGEWPSQRNSQSIGFDWTWAMTPSLVFDFRGGLSRYWSFGGNQFAAGFNPTQLGFPDSLVKQFTTLQFPRFELGEYTAVGASTVTSKDINDTYSLQPNFNWIKGRHIIKFGMEVRRYNRNTIGPGVADGLYQFDKRWSQADPLRADAASGDEWATFMMGYPVGGRVDANIDVAYRWHYLAFYLQNDYKITPKITLNLGIRWDYEQPIRERFDRMVRSFDRTVDSPINSSLPASFKLKGGIIYAGTGGASRGAFNSDLNNLQPRLGIAWNVRPGWVIRAGYGLSYLGQQSFGAALGYSRPTPLVASNDGLIPIASLSDPFPASIYPSGLLKPIGNSQGLSTNLGQAVTGLYNDRQLPYSQQFSLGFQKELMAGWVSDISYVGNITRRLPVSLGLNFIPRNELEKLPVEQRPAYFTEQITNPMAGLIPNSTLNNAKVPRAQLLYSYPQYTGVTMSDVPIGSQYYHALQSRFTRRFANYFSTNVAYTWSKTIEQVNVLNAQDVDLNNLLGTKLEKRLNVYDIPHKLAIQAMFELPFGRGKRFGSDMHRVVNGFVGGWNINLQWIVQSGFILQDYPNAAPLSSKSPKLNERQRLELAKAKGHAYWDVSQDLWYDTSIFPRQARAPYTLQTYPTRFSDVRAQGLNSWEASIYKDIKLTERITFEIRADFQNALNHPWFGQAVSNAVTNARFGLLNADQDNEPRDILLVAKILF